MIAKLITNSSLGLKITFTLEFRARYYRNVIIINKQITLKGADKETTIIDGNKYNDVVSVTAENVSITGFTIQNSGDECESGNCDGGIEIQSSDTKINNNIIKNNFFGIISRSDNNQQIFVNEIISNKANGIVIAYSNNCSIYNNNISNNTYHGIGMDECENNIIENLNLKPIWTQKILKSISNLEESKLF